MNNYSFMNHYILYFILAYMLLFSNIFAVFIGSSSMSGGLLFSILIIFFISLFNVKYMLFSKNKVIIILLFMILILLQYMISSFLYIEQDSIRFIKSYYFMLIVFISSILFFNIITRTKPLYLNRIIFFSFWVLFIIGIISCYTIPFGLVPLKSMFLFSEPSHFSLIYLPLLFYVLYVNKINKNKISNFIFLFGTLIMIITIQNATLMLGFLIILALLFFKYFITIFTLLSFPIILFLGSSADYFINRVMLSSDSDNASALVFMSGYERAYLSTIDSFGIGVGFQQFGIVGPQGSIMQKLSVFGLDKLNYNDGGTVASKLIAELGLLGVILLLLFLYKFLFISKNIIYTNIIGYKSIFFHSFFIMSFITFFIRGAGYFNPSIFMFLVATYGLYTKEKYE